jgi:hypothetical protein
MSLKLRIILDTEEDVLRDVQVNESDPLTDLHELIVKAFQLEPGELASFFKSNDDWDQGEEIGILELSLTGSDTTRVMSDFTLADILNEAGDKMLYVYDYLNLWTFFIDVLSVETEDISESRLLASVGERPKEAPAKEMDAQEDNDPFSSEDDGETDTFDDSEWY